MMHTPAKDLRAHPRIKTNLSVSFASYEFEGGHEGTLADLSLGGCALSNGTAFEPGTYMVLHLHAPDEPTPVTIELAEILRAERERFAVKFVLLDDKEQHRLERLLEKLSSTLS